MATYVGQFEQSIDPKNRLTIPEPFRVATVGTAAEGQTPDGCELMLLPGPGGRLCLYSHRDFHGLLAGSAELGAGRSERLAIMLATSQVVRPDARGRVVIPATMLRRCGLAGAVVLVGTGDHIELWPKAQWQPQAAGGPAAEAGGPSPVAGSQ